MESKYLGEMTVREFLQFTSSASRIVLKDSYNGREYSKATNYLDKKVIGCFPRIKCSSNAFARVELVAWICHDFLEANND